MMQQSLRQLQPPLHAAGKCLGFFFGAIGQPNAVEHLTDALLQRGAAQSVDVADQHQVLFRRELDVDALRLKNHADVAAHQRRLARDIVSHDQRAAAGGKHQRRKNAESRGLAAAVGAKQPEDLRRPHIKRYARQCDAIAVLMAQRLQLNDGSLGDIRTFYGRLMEGVRNGHEGHR